MLNNKKILAVIPARGGSKGIKLKNLKKIRNKSLISIVAFFIKKCFFFDYSVLSTDHNKIKKEAKKNNLKVIDRPKKLSGDRVSDTNVLIHAVKETEKNLNNKFDIIVMLHPTSPLRNIKDIKGSIKKLIVGKLDSVWTISKTDSKYHPDKQLILKRGRLSYFSKKGAKIINRQQLGQVYYRNSAAYVLDRNFLIKKKKLIGNKSSGYIVKNKQISIDTIKDLKLANLLYKK